MTHHQLEAMTAMFAYHDAVEKGGLTTMDLVEVIEAAVEEGFDMLMISMLMGAKAAEMAKEKKRVISG